VGQGGPEPDTQDQDETPLGIGQPSGDGYPVPNSKVPEHEQLAAFLFGWEERLHTIVAALLQDSSAADSFDSLIEKLQNDVAEKFCDFLGQQNFDSKLQWIEILVWAVGLDGIRPVRFSRVLPQTLNETLNEQQTWLYNAFFPEYYSQGFKGFASISELHYQHGVTKDFLLHFSSDEVTAAPPDDSFWTCNLSNSTLKKRSDLFDKFALAIKTTYDKSKADKSAWPPVYEQLNEIIQHFVLTAGPDFGKDLGTDELFKLLDPSIPPPKTPDFVPLKNEKALNNTILAGIFVLKAVLDASKDPSFNVRPSTFAYFLRSAPSITANRTPSTQSFESSIIFVTNDPLKPLEINILRLAGRYTQQILAEAVSSLYHLRNARAAAERAAAGAIFARNLSHNIGSHVMPRAGVSQILARLRELKGRGDLGETTELNMIQTLKAPVDDYIRQKSDFLAEFTTEPLSSASTAFLYRDVVLPFIKNTVLMDCLAANEGQRYESWDTSRLRLRFFSDLNGKACELRPQSNAGNLETIPYGHRLHPSKEEISFTISGKVGENDLGDDNDVGVTLPGALGQFALYGIIENLIRNAAKHNREELVTGTVKHLTLTMRLKNDPSDAGSFRLLIYDNVTDPNRDVEDDEKKANEPSKVPLVSYLSKLAKKPLVDQITGEPRRHSWGMAEIITCANLLSGSRSYSFDANAKAIDVREMTTSDLGEAANGLQNRLVYDIRLLRARHALLCVPSLTKSMRGTSEDWLKAGIVYKNNAAEMRHFLMNTATSPGAFQFAVLDEAIARELLGPYPDPANPVLNADAESLRARLPFRIIRLSDEEELLTDAGDVVVRGLGLNQGLLQPSRVDRIVIALWRTWCRRWLDLARNQKQPGQALVALHLDDDIHETWHKSATAFVQAEAENCRVRGTPPLLLQLTPSKAVAAPNVDPTMEVRAVIFDRHGKASVNARLDLASISYMPFDKQNDDFLSIYEPRFPSDFKEGAWSFPYEMFEAGQLRVLILDERLAERSLTRVDPARDTTLKHLADYLPSSEIIRAQLSLWHVGFAARAYIATHLILPEKTNAREQEGDDAEDPDALHPVSYAASSTKYLATLNSRILFACPRLEVRLNESEPATISGHIHGPNHGSSFSLDQIDVLVVHQGILDTLRKQANLTNTDLMRRLRKITPWVVVESGRGMPTQMQNTSEKFLPFSALDRCFTDARVAKLMLCKRLMERVRAK
jgi:hypothetical protein